MYDKPNEKILYRELSKVEAKEAIEIASPKLQELVNYSTYAFLRCAEFAKNKENEDLAVLVLYLHIIEMTDGIEALISESCINPAIPLVRSSFEALLSIEYIIEDNYEYRALSWLAEIARNRMDYLEDFDSETQKGKEFLKMKKNDKNLFNITLPEKEIIKKMKIDPQKLLDSQKYKQIVAEFKRCKKEDKRKPQWYRLFNEGGKLKNLKDLAYHLQKPVQYEKLYREWSKITHPLDLNRFFSRNKSGDIFIQRLRNPFLISDIANFTAIIILDATEKLLEKFRPGENIDNLILNMKKSFEAIKNYLPVEYSPDKKM